MNAVESRIPPLWQLLFGIIDRPTATFKAVIARRTWWMWAVPLLIIFLSMVVVTVVGAPFGAEIAREQMDRQLASMPADQAEQARTQTATFTSMPFILTTGLIMGTLGLVIGVLAQAAILYFSALLAGGELEFGSVFTVSVWSRLPSTIYRLAQAGFMIFAQRTIQNPGLSVLVATGNMMEDAANPLFMLLGRIDPFWLWHLLLVVLGLSVVTRFSRKKSMMLTLIYVVVSLIVVVLPVIPSILFGGAAGG